MESKTRSWRISKETEKLIKLLSITTGLYQKDVIGEAIKLYANSKQLDIINNISSISGFTLEENKLITKED